MAKKKLYKITDEAKVSGVCAGVAQSILTLMSPLYGWFGCWQCFLESVHLFLSTSLLQLSCRRLRAKN